MLLEMYEKLANCKCQMDGRKLGEINCRIGFRPVGFHPVGFHPVGFRPVGFRPDGFPSVSFRPVGFVQLNLFSCFV